MSQNKTHIFGIRHHGPGSARKLQQALKKLVPDIVLIEGPPDANGMLDLAAHAEMEPPVALLVYNPAALGKAAFYPFAVFSPEWQAIQYGLEEEIPVRFIDLPFGEQRGERREQRGESREQRGERREQRGERREEEGTEEQGTEEQGSEDQEAVSSKQERNSSPLARIAEQAGYADGEKWWDEWVEKRIEGEDVFAAISELMGGLREGKADAGTELREAYMRQQIRKAIKEGYENIAVVCGAFHAPVLQDLPPAKEDIALLKGMKKTKMEACWIPWTYERLSYQSGYGAGVHSPAWYEMMFHRPKEELLTYWLSAVSQAFRKEGLDASPAHVIEAVRLAETLAALRGQAIPGLDEMKEAVETIFCHGQKGPMMLVEKSLVIGQKMGKVPRQAPQFPLQKDILDQKKKFRLKDHTTKQKPLDLDLREDRQREKSHFLHRLQLVLVPFGTLLDNKKTSSTFHEYWQLNWYPELELQIIHAAAWGNTLEEACISRIRALLDEKISLPDLPEWLQNCLWAGLNAVIPALVQALEEQAALDSDIGHLMDALPPLIHILRYGDVRQTEQAPLARVVDGMLPRIIVALPDNCRAIDAAFAEKRVSQLLAIHQAVQLLESDGFQEDWLKALDRIAGDVAAQAQLRGICGRILFDQKVWSLEMAEQAMSQVLSPGVQPQDAAAWLDGFLYGSGLLLVHHPELWKVLDKWLTELDESIFLENVPLLRRTFSKFAAAERRQLGELAQHGKRKSQSEKALNEERKAIIMPILSQILKSSNPQIL